MARNVVATEVQTAGVVDKDKTLEQPIVDRTPRTRMLTSLETDCFWALKLPGSASEPGICVIRSYDSCKDNRSSQVRDRSYLHEARSTVALMVQPTDKSAQGSQWGDALHPEWSSDAGMMHRESTVPDPWDCDGDKVIHYLC